MGQPSYLHRPAKHIQRCMVVDALRKLRVFSPMQDFEYVGFGGMEFVDFELIHRELDVKKMVSIEANGHDAARFEFNAPFRGVDLKFGKASSVLPSLLDAPCLRILWLDYECELNLEVIQDLGTALRKLVPGSVLIVSVNTQGPRKARDRLTRFTANVEVERLPAGVTDATLAKWGWAEASHRVLVAEAKAEAARRYDGAKFEQLFRFHYADGARMLTWGAFCLVRRTSLHSMPHGLRSLLRCDFRPTSPTKFLRRSSPCGRFFILIAKCPLGICPKLMPTEYLQPTSQVMPTSIAGTHRCQLLCS